MQNKFGLFFLSIFSAILLSAAWYFHLTVIIFFAFVPLLYLEDRFSSSMSNYKLKLFAHSYLSFFLWNILVTWWVVYASFGGACMAFIFNSLFMSLVFMFYSSAKKHLKSPLAYWLLIPIWIAWEHWHTIWDLTWTWLTLGNVFAFNHQWVQWYELTGTSGGSLWVLFVNLLVYRTIKENTALKLFSVPILKIAAAIIAPILLSYTIYTFRNSSNKTENIKTLIVQPNIDPYNDKFNWDFAYQFNKTMKILEGKVDAKTDFIVLPETFITENLNEADLNTSVEIQWFRDSLIKKYPNVKIITGANTYSIYKSEKASATARRDQNGMLFDVYNTVLQIDSVKVDIYHKSKLVPGVERMPFPALLKPLESLAINMGGTMGSLGTQPERSIFNNDSKKINVAPVVCYESIFADYTTEYIRLGANLIFIITNDGWWDDTPGYIQHLNYARLRAIENRREIARCANTGISCFIDELGNFSGETEWWQEAVIQKELHPNHSLTFFSRFGDLIAYISLFGTCLLILMVTYKAFKRRFPGAKNQGFA